MKNIKSTLVAAAFVLGIGVFLSVVYFLYVWMFGEGVASGLVSVLIGTFFVLFGLLSLGVTILVCMDVLKSEKMNWKRKILWILFAWFFGVFAAIIYYITEKHLGISDKAVDKLDEMRPPVSMMAVVGIFIAGTALLLSGIFLAEFGILLLALGTVLVLVALYLSKNMGQPR